MRACRSEVLQWPRHLNDWLARGQLEGTAVTEPLMGGVTNQLGSLRAPGQDAASETNEPAAAPATAVIRAVTGIVMGILMPVESFRSYDWLRKTYFRESNGA